MTTPEVVWVQRNTEVVPIAIENKLPKLTLDKAPNSIGGLIINGAIEVPIDVVQHIFEYIPTDELFVPSILLLSKSIFQMFTEASGYEYVTQKMAPLIDTNPLFKIMSDYFFKTPHRRDIAILLTSALRRYNRMRDVLDKLGQYVSRYVRSNWNLGCKFEDLQLLRNQVETFYGLQIPILPVDFLLSWSIHDGEGGGNDTILGVGLAGSTTDDLPTIIGFARLLNIKEIILTLQIHQKTEYVQLNNYNETLYLLPVCF
jgi:hypothetical protein